MTTGQCSHKIETLVDFPVRGLDLGKYVINDDLHDTTLYDLYAVTNHNYNRSIGGHYSAYAQNDETQKWYYFDDNVVKPAGESEIVTAAAYLLFYRKRH